MSEFLSKISPSGEIVAENVTLEDFITRYAETRHEWVEGFVINVVYTSIRHSELIRFFEELLRAYLALNPIGKVHRDPIMVRFPNDHIRLPDLFFVLATTLYTETKIDIKGVPDLCVEIVSQDSIARDYVDKLAEYEAAGVQEYWIIDPLRQQATFNRLQANGLYARIAPNEDYDYESPLFPKLKIHVPTLWAEHFPDFYAMGALVKTMLEGE